jgi:hypothetical protein
MLYIELIHKGKPPPQGGSNARETNYFNKFELDLPPDLWVKAKTTEYISNVQQVYYLNRRLFL